jgi:alpha-tubulin suppressor-like RCC1 family protein
MAGDIVVRHGKRPPSRTGGAVNNLTGAMEVTCSVVARRIEYASGGNPRRLGFLLRDTRGLQLERSSPESQPRELPPGRHPGRPIEALLRADDAEALPCGGLHDLPALHSLDALGAEHLEPGDLGLDVVGLDVEVDAAGVRDGLDLDDEVTSAGVEALVDPAVLAEAELAHPESRAPESSGAVEVVRLTVEDESGEPTLVHVARVSSDARGTIRSSHDVVSAGAYADRMRWYGKRAIRNTVGILASLLVTLTACGGSGGGGASGGDASPDTGSHDGGVTSGSDTGGGGDGSGSTKPLLMAKQVSAGGDHTCAITLSGGVVCWGTNMSGQLGNGTMTGGSAVPVPVMGLSDVTQISAGSGHTCALSAGKVSCWGINVGGQLGNGTNTASPFPMQVTLTEPATDVSCGADATCVILMTGGAECWGANQYGELGDLSMNPSNTPVAVYYSAITHGSFISQGGFFTLAGQEGQLWSWGAGGDGQLGDGMLYGGGNDAPGLVSNLTNVVAASAGLTTGCALTSAGAVYCWGTGTQGELGNGQMMNSTTPVPVTGLSSGIKAVSSAGGSSCVVTSQGGVKCWGQNEVGQLGNGSEKLSSVPVDVLGLPSGVEAISVGEGYFTCALLSNHYVKCWGDPTLGNGSDLGSLVPVDVLAGEAQ